MSEKQAPREAICAIERALDLLIQPGETTQYALAVNIAAKLAEFGYAIVPVEPSEVMVLAGAERHESDAGCATDYGYDADAGQMANIWRAMLEAAE